MNRYSELRSPAARRVHSPAVILFCAGWAFFRTYILRLGFLDGRRGLVIAWSNANGVFFKYMKPYARRRAAERHPIANPLEKNADREYCTDNQSGHVINQETAMPSAVKAIPEGYESVIPYLVVNDGSAAIEFYKKVFDATEVMRFDDKGKIGHAELRIGRGIFMLADEYPDMGYRSPEPGKLPPAGMMVYVQDVDGVVERAVKEGASVEKPVADQFYGDRAGGIVDPFGHRWYIATHIEDLSPEEIGQRAAASG